MKVVIIGAGATGLVAAYLLSREGHQVTMIEASKRPGGLLATFEVCPGSKLEFFYHHFFTHDAEITWLLKELGLAERVLYRKASMGMYRGGRLYPFNGTGDLLRFDAIGLGARLRFGFSSALLVYLKRFASKENRSAMAWFDRWAGREATNAIWRPLLRIKFGDAAEQVSLAWMTGRLRQRARSRKMGEERLGYLEGSLQVLVDRLVEVLEERGVTLRLGLKTDQILLSEGRVTGVTAGEESFHGDRVISTIPTPILSGLVRPVDPGFADALNRIQYMNAMCTVLAVTEPLSDIYWINVADPEYDFGGVIEQTNFVPTDRYGGMYLAYLSRYLLPDHPLWTMEDDELLDRQFEQLGRMYRRDVRSMVKRSWVFRGRFAAPLTDRGFHERIPRFETPIPGLYMAAMPHIYPDERSVNNSIRISAEMLRVMGMERIADEVPRGLSLAATYGH